MVEAGFGLVLLPERSVDEELRTRTLCAVRIPAMRVTILVALVHRRRYLSGATRGLIAALEAWPARRSSLRRRGPTSSRHRSVTGS
jgi:DNA-binding transcriptional LysR family regulator